jgi:arsenate reductase (thioredoxin)
MSATPKLRVLFLCTGNTCRSQMAEGWARVLKGKELEPFSAGLKPTRLHPLAVKVMLEAGVDISRQASKHVDTLWETQMDYVVTLCGHAHETCPQHLDRRSKVIHAPFDDPVGSALLARTEDAALDMFRRVRDEIRSFIATLPQSLERRYQALQRLP